GVDRLTTVRLPILALFGLSIDPNLPAGKAAFDILTDFAMFGAVIFETMAVLSIFVFRWRFPKAERPYRCWGYPVTPALYVLLPLPPPGPKGHWLFGNLADWKRDILAFNTLCAREYGDIVTLRVANRRHILVSHPDGVEEVLATRNRHYVKNFAQRMLAPWLG